MMSRKYQIMGLKILKKNSAILPDVDARCHVTDILHQLTLQDVKKTENSNFLVDAFFPKIQLLSRRLELSDTFHHKIIIKKCQKVPQFGLSRCSPKCTLDFAIWINF